MPTLVAYFQHAILMRQREIAPRLIYWWNRLGINHHCDDLFYVYCCYICSIYGHGFEGGGKHVFFLQRFAITQHVMDQLALLGVDACNGRGENDAVGYVAFPEVLYLADQQDGFMAGVSDVKTGPLFIFIQFSFSSKRTLPASNAMEARVFDERNKDRRASLLKRIFDFCHSMAFSM